MSKFDVFLLFLVFFFSSSFCGNFWPISPMLKMNLFYWPFICMNRCHVPSATIDINFPRTMIFNTTCDKESIWTYYVVAWSRDLLYRWPQPKLKTGTAYCTVQQRHPQGSHRSVPSCWLFYSAIERLTYYDPQKKLSQHILHLLWNQESIFESICTILGK